MLRCRRLLSGLSLAATLVLPLLGQQALAAETAAEVNYRGIYVVVNPNVAPNNNTVLYAQYEAALASPNVDGLTLIVRWSDMYATTSPGPQNYKWSAIDYWAAQAMVHNKKISLGIVAGMYTPAWLLSSPYSVPTHAFTFNSGAVANANCVTRILPLPWNRTFVNAYKQMITDLSAHLQATGAYSALKIVKLDGINEVTEELGVGATRQADYNCPLNNSDYLTTGWQKAGYTFTQINFAWHAITTRIAFAFPNQVLSVDVLGSQSGFPSIDALGNIVPPPSGATDATTAYFLSAGLLVGPERLSFHTRLSVQWDALSNIAPDPEVQTARTMGAQAAWQMNDGLGAAGSGCMSTNNAFQPCQSSAQYQQMLDNGLNLGGQFIEIAAPNVTQFSDALAEAHDRLTGATN